MDVITEEGMWNIIENAIERIQNKNYHDISIIKLHSITLKMMKMNAGSMMYIRLAQILTKHIKTKIRDYLLRSMNNNFLQTINNVWNEHHYTMTIIDTICSYLNGMYAERNDIENVYNLGLIIFRDQVFGQIPIRNLLRKIMLTLVMEERNGEVIDRSTLKNVSQMLITLGINSRTLYEDIFERQFLPQSECFYKKDSRKCLKSNSICLYIRNVQSRINEETERTNHSLHISTKSRILKIIQIEMINKQLKTILELENDGISEMIANQQTADLASIYKLFYIFPDGAQVIHDCVSNYIRKEGEALVNAKERPKYGISFIQKIVYLKEKLDNILNNSFKSNLIIKEIIKESFEYILKLNCKSAEHLALFIDDKMRKSLNSISEGETEAVLDITINLYRLLQEKDLFLQHHQRYLAKRLLNSKHLTNDLENYFISKLKYESGSCFTIKLEGMTNDLNVSRTIMEEFKEYVTSRKINLLGMELKVNVLTWCRWPVSWEERKCFLPINPQVLFDVFKDFYLKKHSRRKLTLLSESGSGNLDAYFNPSVDRAPRKYNLQVSTHQMCVLMLFNKRDSLSYREIVSETSIPENHLTNALQSLTISKHRILIKRLKTNGNENSDIFCFNEAFVSKCQRVKIKQTVAVENIKEKSIKTRITVEADRKVEVDAAITRIMKTQKEMCYALLVAEVTNQLKARFHPSPSLIKSRLEELIHKEYLERSKEDRTVYRYIA